MKLRVGIAGYGVVGKRRKSCIDKIPEMEVVAVCDRYFKENQVLDDGVKAYQSYKGLLEENLDVLFVCLTNNHHT